MTTGAANTVTVRQSKLVPPICRAVAFVCMALCSRVQRCITGVACKGPVMLLDGSLLKLQCCNSATVQMNATCVSMGCMHWRVWQCARGCIQYRHTTGWEGIESSDAHAKVTIGAANAASVRQSELLPPHFQGRCVCVYGNVLRSATLHYWLCL